MDCNHARKHPSAGGSATRLADLPHDPVDKILLTLSRHLFRALSAPESGNRHMAVTYAGLSLGPGRGAMITAALQQAIVTMRRARRDRFFYNNPDCPLCAGHLTGAELQLVQVFRAVRLSRTSAAVVHAMLLCEGNDYTPFLDAVLQLTDVLAAPYQ